MSPANNSFNDVSVSLRQSLVVTCSVPGVIGAHVTTQTSLMKLHRCLSHWEIVFRRGGGLIGAAALSLRRMGATVNAAWVFSLLWLPVKSQSMTQEDGACQYQPMMSWERKWVGLNGPQVIFEKSLGNLKTASAESDRTTRVSLSVVLSGTSQKITTVGSVPTASCASMWRAERRVWTLHAKDFKDLQDVTLLILKVWYNF